MALVVQYAGPAMVGAPSTTVLDESGNGRNGTLGGGSTLAGLFSADRPGVAGRGSLHFDGIDDEIVMPALAAFMGDNASAMAWVKLDVATPASPNQTGLWTLGASYIGNAAHHPYTGGTGYYPTFRGSDNATVSRVDNVNLAAGGDRTQWHHLAITTSPGAGGWKLWIDAVEITTVAGLTPVYYDNDLWSFGQSTGGGFFFDGYVWDFRLYNTNEAANLAAIMAAKNTPTASARSRGMGVGIGIGL